MMKKNMKIKNMNRMKKVDKIKIKNTNIKNMNRMKKVDKIKIKNMKRMKEVNKAKKKKKAGMLNQVKKVALNNHNHNH
jgi:hypothetical protein